MKISNKLRLMEKLYGGEEGAARIVGVSWDAWRRWKLPEDHKGTRKVSRPVEKLIDIFIERAGDAAVNDV